MVTHTSLFTLLHGMYHTGVPVVIFGAAGIGKTSIVKKLGQVLGVTTVTKSSSKVTDVDLSGIPYLIDVLDDDKETKPANVVNVKSHKEVRISVPTYIKQLGEEKRGILFFDELATASIDIQKQMLSVIQDGELNDFRIPLTTFRVAACNYTNIQGNKLIQQALLNRMCHFHVPFDADNFCSGFASGFSNYVPAIINNEADREKKLLQYKLLIVDFIKANPQYGESMPEDVTDERDQAFPSPRAWENVAKVLSVLDGNDADFIETCVCGLVGDGVGKLFLAFKDTNDLFDIDLREYVGKEDEFKFPHPNDHSEVYQIVSAGVSYFNNDCKKYLKLLTHIFNLCHNEDNKFGNYVAYDNFVVSYLHGVLDTYKKEVDQNQLADTIQWWAGTGKYQKDKPAFDNWNNLAALTYVNN